MARRILPLKSRIRIIINLVRLVSSPGPDIGDTFFPHGTLASRRMTGGHRYREKAPHSREQFSAKQVFKNLVQCCVFSSISFHFAKFNIFELHV